MTNAACSRPKLAEPSSLKWPCITVEEEKSLLTELESVFAKYAACMRTVKRKVRGKKEEGMQVEDKLTAEEEQQRKLFKSQFVVGLQSVIRGLEKDQLSALMIWKDLEPAVLRKVLLQLLSQRECPAVCVSDVLTPLKKYWTCLSSATVVGILKSDQPNDFDELVKKVTEISPIKRPLTSPSVEDTSSSSLMTSNSVNSREHIQRNAPVIESMTDGGVAEHDSVKGNETKHDSGSRKYYIYKSEANANNKPSFSGQSFMAFGDDSASNLCTVVEFAKGARVKTTSERVVCSSYGIMPSCEDKLMETNRISESSVNETSNKGKHIQSQIAGSKRTFDSGYQPISVQKLKKNTEKKQKPKKKKVGKKKNKQNHD